MSNEFINLIFSYVFLGDSSLEEHLSLPLLRSLAHSKEQLSCYILVDLQERISYYISCRCKTRRMLN